MFSRQRTTRNFGVFGGAAALALAAALSLGQVALADTTQGQTGDLLWTDDASHVGAVCFNTTNTKFPNDFYLSKITVKPPSMWWMDRNSSNNNEHGTVGWRFTVQNDNATGTNWHNVYRSSYQKATAYEDSQSPYNKTNGTRAPFTKRSVSLNGHAYIRTSGWRVIVRAQWYNPDGSVLGWSNHTVFYYVAKLNGNSGPDSTGYCANDYTRV